MAIFFCLILGCSNSTGPAEEYITGVVVDASGRPVAGAYLNFYYNTPYNVNHLAKTSSHLTIQFRVPHRAYILLWAENYISQPVKHLLADTLAAGEHLVGWSFDDDQGRNLYSDCYKLRLVFDDTISSTLSLLDVEQQHLTPNPALFAMTNWMGRFAIPKSRLPLGESWVLTSDSPDSIGILRIGAKDPLYAFTQTAYGLDSVVYNRPRDLKIVLSHPKNALQKPVPQGDSSGMIVRFGLLQPL